MAEEPASTAAIAQFPEYTLRDCVAFLRVPGFLESWNEAWGRTRWIRDKITKRWEQIIYVEALRHEMRGLNLTGVHIDLTRFGPRALDCDNVMAKPFIDGLKYAAIIKGDDPKAVLSVTTRSEQCAKKDARVEVRFYRDVD